MISVKEARKILQNNCRALPQETVPFDEATGRVLQENLYADRDFPPFDRVTMDGIAIYFPSFEAGQKAFEIAGIAPAGTPQQLLKDQKACLEVMTGAPLPKGCDTVIRYEDLEIENGTAIIQLDELTQGKNVHRKGSDRKAGDLLVTAPKTISAAEIGVAATVGKTKLLVSRLPKVAIISTGDELVNVNEQPQPHQIRKSNVHSLKSALEKKNIEADTFHLLDDYEAIIGELKTILETYDVLILSGGVSKGKYDYIPDAMEALGVKKLFYKVQQRPGKPFWLGRSEAGKMVFALPGNPVSTFMCLHCCFLPWLDASLGLPEKPLPKAVLMKTVSFKPDLVYYLQVQIQYGDNGQLQAVPVEGNGSGDLANLTHSDGFLELPQGKTIFEAGEVFPFLGFR